MQKVGLRLDNDNAGIKARERITSILLERGYGNVFPLFSVQKDWNKDLQAKKQESQMSEQEHISQTISAMA
ncbi:MAG: toprim domain-containing protein [Oscillospiraceae bacterium]|nr:toprim domain-containing protein [Oscillospiraceae bacterium]